MKKEQNRSNGRKKQMSNKIQTLHKAMQVINAAHKEAKGEIYEIIEGLIQENEKLERSISRQASRIAELEARSGNPVRVTGQVTLVDAEDHPAAEPETVTHTVDPEKVKAKQEEDERMSLVESLVSDHLVKTADPTGENWQLHVETLSRLAEVVGITAKEGTAPNRIPVLLVAKDSTGSMGVWETFMAKCVAHWAKELLELHYGKCVDARYISFNMEGSVEGTFEECFVKGADGGTKVSPAVKKLNSMADDYDYEEKHDVYVLLLSDGDNIQSDKNAMVKQIERLAPKTEKLWYVEMNQYNRLSNVLNTFKKEGELTKPILPNNMSAHIITTKGKVYTSLFDMFKEE
ncbi:RNA binding protein [Bacillus phage vB_BanH_Emiliahah]|nr:RNA binding protein [Bacillus phage vB_BanH_Emiliahah]